MKRIAVLLWLASLTLCANADVIDAFKGILPVTDPAMQKSLNGLWSLKVVPRISDSKSVPASDSTWGTIPVPGCWEAHGFCPPRYDYPDSLTGYYRTSFTVPEEWRGQQIILRLDGVLRGYDLWLNDRYVGSWQSAYNTCLFDLTPFLRKHGTQQLAMRVYTQFKGYEFDCFDDWAANGIFRDVTLMAVPCTHLSDLTVTTRMNGEVTVAADIANATSHTFVDCQILDAQGHVVASGSHCFIPNPHLWTAETPYLYTLCVSLKDREKTLQNYVSHIGIREISIDGNILKLNGRPVKLRGVNAHSTDPYTVKVISDSLMLKDMRMMKEASVNCMRLSHYPREPRFYELADSLGFYLISEVPFGFGDKHLGSRSYQDILLTRAHATIQRDKNHPSVLLWSVGNENPLPPTCVEVGDYVGRLDSSRPYCFPQVGSYFRKFWEKKPADGTHPFPSQAPVYAPHYPTTGQIAGFYQQLDRPVVFTEYCHTLGISFEDHDRQWEIIERTPGIAGGSVWEWADQGMPFCQPLQDHYGYEEKVFTSADGGFEMYGNKGTDGLVYADRTPLPNYYELQHNYARAAVTDSVLTFCDDGSLLLNIRNRYDFLNLRDNVTFQWTLTSDRDTLCSGSFSPDCQPRQTIQYRLQPESCNLQPETCNLKPEIFILQLKISDSSGLVFLRQSIPVSPVDITPRLLDGIQTALSSSLPIQDGPLVRVGRKPTMAERLKVSDARLEHYLLRLPAAQADIHTESVGPATHYVFTLNPEGMQVGSSKPATDAFLSELGVAFLLDKRIDRVQWIGKGPYATYPGRCRAGRYGFWSMQQGDLYFEGNRRGVDAAWLSDAEGNGILVICSNANISFEQTDRGIVLTYNVAVSGEGPKFARTAFPVYASKAGTLGGDFYFCPTTADHLPQILHELFCKPCAVPAPFRPYETQYDTYLMRFADIVSE